MKKIFVLLILMTLLGLVIWKINSSTPPIQQISNQSAKSSGIPKFDHIAIIVMENKPIESIVGSTNAPFINSLVQKYSLAGNYFAITHPSLPNYLAILGGSTFGINSDCSDCFINSNNLIDQLESNHKSWKAYMESMPSSCFIGNSGNYAQKHNPFIYFNNIRNNPQRCQNIVPLTNLSADLIDPLTSPNFIWITPNLCHDMHDCSIKVGDGWLSEQIPLILKSPSFTLSNSLLVITWDEAETIGSNQIPTIFIGPSVKQSYISQIKYDHYSLLHTIESAWDLQPLTENDKNATLMNDFFR